MSCGHSEFAWSKFWWRDYERDRSLRLVSLAAQGLWMRMLCVMAEGSPYGHLTMHGKPMEPVTLAKFVGVRKVAVERLLAELEEAGVFSRTPQGTVYSRRMDRERKLRTEARENGARGGNPALISEISPSYLRDNSENKPRNEDGTVKRVSPDFNGLDDSGVNPPSNPPSNPPVKLQEAKKQEATTTGEKPPGGGRRKRPKQGGLELGNEAKPDDPPADRAKADLFAQGLPLLNAMAGGDNASFVGKLLGKHPDGAARILALIREAHRRFVTPGEALDNAKAWIVSVLSEQGRDAAEPLPEYVNDWPVADVARYSRHKADVPDDHWPGLERVVCRLLKAGATPDHDIYPVMEGFRRQDPQRIGLGLVYSAVRQAMADAAAVRRAA